MVVRIPPDRPRVYLRHLGRSVELPTTPHRVLVSMLEMGVYVVWHAAWPLPDGFFDSITDADKSFDAFWDQLVVLADQERLLPLESMPGSKP